MSDVQLSLVCALARNRVIGADNQLPWHLPRDLAYFKAVTMGHPIIMGRKTFDSIGRPLPGRRNIVVTRQEGWAHEGVTTVNSLESAVTCATELAQCNGVCEVMLIGGPSLFAQALPLAHRMYLTEVHADVAGDVYFPSFPLAEWVEVKREEYAADEKNLLACAFVTYDRASFLEPKADKKNNV